MNWITALGLTSATFTTISFLPQAIKTIKTKQTKDLSLGTYIILNIGESLWIVYGFMIQDLPVILANVVTLSFTLTILVLKIKHK